MPGSTVDLSVDSVGKLPDGLLPVPVGAPGASSAERLANAYFAANLKALEVGHSHIAGQFTDLTPPDVDWLFGRDGSLTVRDPLSRWHGGSSLPLLVGRSLMKSLDLHGSVGLFLSPGTAGQIRAAIEKLSANQSIIIAIPDLAAAWIALHCDDFSAAIAGGGMWLVCGEFWAGQLAELLAAYPGMCVPQQFIRTGLISEAEVAAMMGAANPVLAAETNRRADLTGNLQNFWPMRTSDGEKRLCVVGGTTFAPWELAGPTLWRILGETPNALHLNKDNCISASPLALARAASECDALIAADLYRADLPGAVHEEMPWLTWATQPRIAPPQLLACNDRILLADPAWRAAAMAAGWAEDRISVAGWPALIASTPVPRNGPLCFIADAPATEVPQSLRDYSSHAVLWEQIAAELAEDPFAVGGDIDGYLSLRVAQLEIEADSISRELFMEKLILPAWRRGMARLLIRAGMPLVVFGAGWNEGVAAGGAAGGRAMETALAAEFSSHWGGVIASMDDLRKVAGLASAMVYPVPLLHGHPVFALGRPVLRPASTFAALARGAAALLKTPSLSQPVASVPLAAEGVLALL